MNIKKVKENIVFYTVIGFFGLLILLAFAWPLIKLCAVLKFLFS